MHGNIFISREIVIHLWQAKWKKNSSNLNSSSIRTQRREANNWFAWNFYFLFVFGAEKLHTLKSRILSDFVGFLFSLIDVIGYRFGQAINRKASEEFQSNRQEVTNNFSFAEGVNVLSILLHWPRSSHVNCRRIYFEFFDYFYSVVEFFAVNLFMRTRLVPLLLNSF